MPHPRMQHAAEEEVERHKSQVFGPARMRASSSPRAPPATALAAPEYFLPLPPPNLRRHQAGIGNKDIKVCMGKVSPALKTALFQAEHSLSVTKAQESRKRGRLMDALDNGEKEKAYM